MPFSLGRKTRQDDRGLKRLFSRQPAQKPQGVPTESSVEREREEREELQRRWEEYDSSYAKGIFDIEHPPLPPQLAISSRSSSSLSSRPCHPYSTPTYQPKRHPEDELHQRVLDSLNIYGGRAGKEAVLSRLRSLHPYAPSLRPETPFSAISASHTVSPTLVNHRLCHEIVTQTRLTFGGCSVLLAVFDEDRLLFIGSSGHEHNTPFFAQNDGFLPRQASFCAHMVLNQNRGLVVVNAQEDWRFANNGLGVAFYAAFPVTAPVDLNDPTARRVPIGSLCLIDGRPRANFAAHERKQLSNLANLASASIEAWAKQQRTGRPMHPVPLGDDSVLTFSPPPSLLSRRGSLLTVTEEGEPSSLPYRHDPPLRSHWSATTATITTAAPTPLPPVTGSNTLRRLGSSTQFLIDLAITSVSTRLSAPLVYVLHISVSKSPFSVTKRMVSCHGEPSSYLSFAGGLHLHAMRAGGDGIKYEPPAVPDPLGLAGGIVLPVMRDVDDEDGEESGAVLAVFWEEEGKTLGQENMLYLHQVVRAMAEHAM
ncbi:hypothetical protein JCM10213_007526 [Rhodosporidiobolus nylandii]